MRQMNDGTPAEARKLSTASVIALAAVAALVGFAAVYGTVGRPDNTGVSGLEKAAPQAAARRTAPGLPAFVFKKSPEPVADVGFVDGSGAPRTLKDFRGKIV